MVSKSLESKKKLLFKIYDLQRENRRLKEENDQLLEDLSTLYLCTKGIECFLKGLHDVKKDCQDT